jgi:hypothetical protein
MVILRGPFHLVPLTLQISIATGVGAASVRVIQVSDDSHAHPLDMGDHCCSDCSPKRCSACGRNGSEAHSSLAMEVDGCSACIPGATSESGIVYPLGTGPTPENEENVVSSAAVTSGTYSEIPPHSCIC